MSENDWNTRLIDSLLFGREHNVTEALDNGANPNSISEMNSTGDSALHLAVRIKKSNAPLQLLQAGADVSLRSNYGSTPLHAAALSAHAHHVEMLLHHSADPNSKNDNGYTALHTAAGTKDEQTLSALMRAGARLEETSNDGQTAEQLAMKKNNGGFMLFLAAKRKLGASIEPAAMPEKLVKSALLDAASDNGEFCVNNIGFWQEFGAAADRLKADGQPLSFSDLRYDNNGEPQHLLDKASHFFATEKALQVLAEQGAGLTVADIVSPEGITYHYVDVMAENGTLNQLFNAELWRNQPVAELRQCYEVVKHNFPAETEAQVHNIHQLIAQATVGQQRAHGGR